MCGAAMEEVEKLCQSLQVIPPYYRSFYLRRLADRISTALDESVLAEMAEGKLE